MDDLVGDSEVGYESQSNSLVVRHKNGIHNKFLL